MKLSRISFLLIFICCFSVKAVTVGSNSASSRQLKAFFPSSDVNNLLRGFAVFEKGFTFEDSITTCSFDAFFPVSGDVVLNGGTLFLLRDFKLKNPFALGLGTISGESTYSIEFPGNCSGISLPSENHTKILSLMDTQDADSDVYSVDWSYDEKYLAVGSRGSSSYSELKIYYFDGMTLTVTASQNVSSYSVQTVKWHPSSYYIAAGNRGSSELEFYYLYVGNGGALKNTDSVNLSNVSAVAWSPNGDYLAVGEVSQANLRVYAVENGVAGNSYSASLSGGSGRTVQNNALDWDSTGNYIAVGLDAHSSDAEVKVFYFNGSSLVESAKLDFDFKANAYAVAWVPNSFLLSVGMNSSSDRLRLYEYNSGQGTLTEKVSARVGDGKTVYALDWSSDGTFLAVGKDASSATHEVRIFAFNSSDITLSLVAGYESGQDVMAVSWSPNNNYLAAGDKSDNVRLFELKAGPLVFRNINLFLNSDITFRAPVVFDGNCIINGGGNIFSFDGNGSISVESGGALTIENAVMRGIGANNIACVDDTAVITLRDIGWQQDSDYTFSVGALRLQNDILMSGDATFAYSSSQTSTLLAKSELELDVGFTFSYDSGSESKTLFEMVDETSKLTLNGATLHATVTGMELTNGRLRVLRDSYISSETQYVQDGSFTIDEGVTFGSSDGAHDLDCDIYGGVTLWVTQGSLRYKNVNSSSWLLHNIESKLRLGVGVTLYLHESLYLEPGMLVLDDQAVIARALGKDVIGSICPLGTYLRLHI